eukprot:PhF_6_TR8729/c0_g1_i2/m.13721
MKILTIVIILLTFACMAVAYFRMSQRLIHPAIPPPLPGTTTTTTTSGDISQPKPHNKKTSVTSIPSTHPTATTGNTVNPPDEEEQGKNIHWSPAKCMKGTFIVDPRLAKVCSNPGLEYVCDGKDKCGQWASGTFSQKISTKAVGKVADDAGECDLATLDTVVTSDVVSFREDTNEIVHNSCKLRSMRSGVVDILNAVKNRKRIVFTGDSMMRQLYLRIISLIRKEPTHAEHYFHQDSVYVLTESGDELIVFTDKGKRSQSFPDALLVMYFLWDPKPSVYRKEAFTEFNPDIIIAAFMYWWQPKDKTTDVDQYLHALQTYLTSSKSSSGNSVQYFFVTTPWTADGTFGGVPTPIRNERNQHIIKELRSWNAPNVHVVDYSGIADLKKMPKTADNIHYMCIWTPKWPQNVNGMKYNSNQCKDYMNLAVATWWLNMLS